jgi:hypothetical protein
LFGDDDDESLVVAVAVPLAGRFPPLGGGAERGAVGATVDSGGERAGTEAGEGREPEVVVLSTPSSVHEDGESDEFEWGWRWAGDERGTKVVGVKVLSVRAEVALGAYNVAESGGAV